MIILDGLAKSRANDITSFPPGKTRIYHASVAGECQDLILSFYRLSWLIAEVNITYEFV